MKTDIQTISLILSIISLIYVILDYYGLIRYLKMFIYSPKKYIKNYKKLEFGCENRVVISLTTTPSRIKKIHPIINSLLDQTTKVDLIAITVPYGTEYNLPSDLHDTVSLYRTGGEYKELSCLIPVIKREGEKTTKIITLGDDKIYGKDFIEILLTESKKHPDKTVYVGDKKSNIDVKKGVVFKTGFFDSGFVDFPDGYSSFKWVKQHVKNKHSINYKENYKLIF